jgi:3-oxoadipate enol-lactonase
MPYAKVNDINLYYEVHGEGQPLTIINGLSVDISKFGVVAEAFAKTHKVLVFDNRGAGRSDKPDKPYSIEQMAGDAAGVMEEAGFKKSDIVGISMGGRIALELTLSKPDMIDRLVLVSTGARVKQKNWFRSLATQPPVLFKGKYPQPRYALRLQPQIGRNTSSDTNCAWRER